MKTKISIFKIVFLVALFITLASCGYDSKNNQTVGQVKKVIRETPLICDDRMLVDISLGVMRNGVGSMSREDMVLSVQNERDFATLQTAIDNGQLVKITYDARRFAFCMTRFHAVSVEIVK